MFDWCSSGQHDRCIREYERFYFNGKSMVMTGEIRKCQCPKRGCKCYVPPADRPKKRRVKKK